MNNSKKITRWAFWIVATIIVMLLLAWKFEWLVQQPSGAAPRHLFFSGQVIDQAGNSVPSAKIKVRLCDLVRTSMVGGGYIDNKQTQMTFDVYSDVNGIFVVTIPRQYYVLNIDAIEKQGYEWVFDWAWASGTKHDKNDNRRYVMQGEYWKCPYYEPFNEKPAIFPLHLIGSPLPATRPSRGGFDIQCDGTKIANGLVDFFVPSAGQSAPQGNEAINSAIRQFIEQHNDTVTGPSR